MVQKILVVDDQFGIRLLLKEVLEREGYQVLLAVNGADALACVALEKPDLILLDMKIPGMDGIGILTNIRKQQVEVKVVIMTAYGELELLQEASALGAAGHLSKPFDIDDLKCLVEREIGPAEGD